MYPLFTEFFQHLDTVHFGHHYIKDNTVIVFANAVVVGIKPVIDGVDGIVAVFQHRHKSIGKLLFVLCKQKSHTITPYAF